MLRGDPIGSLCSAARRAVALLCRRHSETESRIEAERLHLALAAADLGTWDYDVARGISTLNAEMSRIFGLGARREATPEAIFATILPAFRPAVKAAFDAALDPQGSGDYSARYMIARVDDGAERWVASRARARRDNGAVTGLIGVCRDITEERAFDQLTADRARLAEEIVLVTDSAPGMICTFRRDAAGRFSFPFASRHFFDIYGLRFEEAHENADVMLRRVHPDDAAALQDSIDRSATTMSVWRHEFRYLHPDRGEIWIEGQSTPSIDPAGGVLWRGYIQDITDRKGPEQMLRASEARARALYDADIIGMFVWRPDGRITDANDRFLAMLGFDRRALAAGELDWRALTSRPMPSSHDLDGFAEAKDGATAPGPYETELVCRNGERLPVLMQGAPIDPSIGEGIAVALDIRDRKQAERRLAVLNAERMKTLAALAGAIAHEVNQPLAAAGVYLKTLRRLIVMDPEKRPLPLGDTIDKADAQFTRAGQLIARLREFVAHGEPDLMHTRLHEVIASAVAQSEPKAGELGVSVKLDLAAPNDETLADAMQIERVVINLVDNALDAMKNAARRELTVSTAVDGDEIRVDIADSGAGFAPGVAETLFEPFVTTKRANMGVGLAVCRAIVAAHHGRIFAAPPQEGRAMISFTLPLHEASAPAI